MDQVILLVLLIVMVPLFLSVFIAILMAPSSANKEWLHSEDCGKMEILQIPHLYLKRCYEPSKLYVHKMAVAGTIGLAICFSVLYVLAKFGIV